MKLCNQAHAIKWDRKTFSACNVPLKHNDNNGKAIIEEKNNYKASIFIRKFYFGKSFAAVKNILKPYEIHCTIY